MAGCCSANPVTRLRFERQWSGCSPIRAPRTEGGDPAHLRTVERRHVLDTLRAERGNKVHAARMLGISRRALYRLIAKYRLRADDYTA